MDTKFIFLIIVIVILIGITALSAMFGPSSQPNQKTSPKNPGQLAQEMKLPQAQSQNQIFIKEGALIPPMLNVKKGSTITWVNKETQTRQIVNVAADAYDQGEIFKTGQIKPNGQESVVANTVGQFQYFCLENQNIRGEIIVTE